MYPAVLAIAAAAVSFATVVGERSESISRLISVHKQLIHSVVSAFMFIANLCFLFLRFPIFGLLITFMEIVILIWLIYGRDYVTAACRAVASAIYSMVTFQIFGSALADSDGRIAELQEMVNTLMEENHKLMEQNSELMGQVAILRKEIVENSSIVNKILSMTGGSFSAFHLAEIVLLVCIVLMFVAMVCYLVVSTRRPRSSSSSYLELESYRAGSEFFPTQRPKAVVRIADSDSGLPLGHGVVVSSPVNSTGAILVTAKHVTSEAEKIRLTSGGAEPKTLTIKNEPIDLGDDVVAYPLAKTDVSARLSIGKDSIFKLSSVSEDRAISSVMVHADNIATMGMLKPSGTFGQVAYTGSTQPGFSGTPYLVGRTVKGVHTGSSASFNVGVDAALINMRLRQHAKEANHATAIESDDTGAYVYNEVKSQLGSGRNVQFKHYGDDQYEVRIKGKYFRVYEDDMVRMGLLQQREDIYTEADAVYQDSENFPQGSARVQAPGPRLIPAGASSQSCTGSKSSPTSPPPPVPSTSTSTLPHPSTSAQPEPVSALIAEYLRKLTELQAATHVATEAQRKKGAAKKKGQSALQTKKAEPSTSSSVSSAQPGSVPPAEKS
nr:MAG: putative peptidase [Eriocheir sinensis sobemo-like virus 1]